MFRPTACFVLPVLFLALGTGIPAQTPSPTDEAARAQEAVDAAATATLQETAKAQAAAKSAKSVQSLETDKAFRAVQALKDRSMLEDAVTRYGPEHFYHLDFLIQELGVDGKPINSRSFTTTTSTGQKSYSGQIRSGTKVPIVTATTPPTAQNQAQNQIQYIDLGVKIDIHETSEIGNRLAFRVAAELSSLAAQKESETLPDPVVHQYRWDSRVLIPVGKPTVIFSSDNLDNKGGMQVLVTATPLQ